MPRQRIDLSPSTLTFDDGSDPVMSGALNLVASLTNASQEVGKIRMQKEQIAKEDQRYGDQRALTMSELSRKHGLEDADRAAAAGRADYDDFLKQFGGFVTNLGPSTLLGADGTPVGSRTKSGSIRMVGGAAKPLPADPVIRAQVTALEQEANSYKPPTGFLDPQALAQHRAAFDAEMTKRRYDIGANAVRLGQRDPYGDFEGAGKGLLSNPGADEAEAVDATGEEGVEVDPANPSLGYTDAQLAMIEAMLAHPGAKRALQDSGMARYRAILDSAGQVGKADNMGLPIDGSVDAAGGVDPGVPAAPVAPISMPEPGGLPASRGLAPFSPDSRAQLDAAADEAVQGATPPPTPAALQRPAQQIQMPPVEGGATLPPAQQTMGAPALLASDLTNGAFAPKQGLAAPRYPAAEVERVAGPVRQGIAQLPLEPAVKAGLDNRLKRITRTLHETADGAEYEQARSELYELMNLIQQASVTAAHQQEARTRGPSLLQLAP
jgi:hypothetical protein